MLKAWIILKCDPDLPDVLGLVTITAQQSFETELKFKKGKTRRLGRDLMDLYRRVEPGGGRAFLPINK